MYYEFQIEHTEFENNVCSTVVAVASSDSYQVLLGVYCTTRIVEYRSC